MSAYAATPPPIPITITPSTGLTGGESVTITGSGFAHGSPGNVLECNSDPKQPNVVLPAPVSSPVSVSCTAISLSALVATSSTGALSTTFKVVQGTVGPPCGPPPALLTCPATDDGGGSPTADAALYPCPPTAAQQAAGDVCTLTYGDQANDNGTGTILFAGETAPAATTTTGAPPPTTATTRAPAPTTTAAPVTAGSTATTIAAPAAAATSGTLASTGPGRGVGLLGVIGGVLILSGFLLLLLRTAPRRALAGFVTPTWSRKTRVPIHDAVNRSLTRHVTEATSRWAGQLNHLGRRLGDHTSGAPQAARGVAHKVATASARTATWFLGR
ncbi:MAG TPA: neocarzinostatin apoprotein domain-containing protein [Acidimicrobiales bacterium]